VDRRCHEARPAIDLGQIQTGRHRVILQSQDYGQVLGAALIEVPSNDLVAAPR